MSIINIRNEDGTFSPIPAIVGPPGKSAYKVACEAGYTGTEAEFSAKLAENIPTKVSQLENDKQYITIDDMPSGLPENVNPNQQLVTDADGNLKWEERVGYKDWDYIEESDIPVGIYSQGYGSLPFELFPVVGEEYTIAWDGAQYNCPSTIITIDDEDVTIIGSTTFFGGTVAPDIPVSICCRSGKATVYSNESGEHTIGVSGYVMNPVKIPREYIDWNPVVGVIDSSWYNYRYLNETRGASIAEIRKAAREKNKDIIIRLDLDNWQGTMRYLGLIDVSEDGETYLPALVFSTIKTNNASINVADETINGTMELEYWYTPLEPTEGPPANAFVNFQFGKVNLKDTVKSVDGILPDEDGNVQLNVENTGIKRVESLDKENLIQLRDLETGPYVLYGWFSPFPNSDISMTFDNTIVVVSRKDAGSHLLVLTGLNSKINFLEILVDEANEKGFTYTRTDYVMNDLYALLSRVDALEQPRNSISMVDKETGTTYILEVSNGSLMMTEVTE